LQIFFLNVEQKMVQKEMEQTDLVVDAHTELLLALQRESPAFVWSPYDSHEAAEALSQLLKDN
jgi:hypothetical protein